ncbi:ATP-binding protein [Fontisphaera persica]|uniref:ATP-binding response regulator n=1 Tax=Fontisphaera persica TaxID=2974023 RepID=UPI0024BFEA30|nr:ATP-binding protein [Fontisphaera persica]WCJ59102.1 ATP-binding protein [Fontisphaera persica]
MPLNGKVLIVDDDSYVCATMEALLKNEGHELIFASSGAEGQAKALAERPDVILLDVMMPEMDGYEVCRRLKADPATAAIPVLLVTALTERKERLKGIEAGANDYLTKPIDAQDLRLRVRNAIYTRKLYDQLQQSFEQLKELEALRDNLTHMIVHDMRSSLGSVLGFAQLLKASAKNKLDEREANFLNKVERNTNLLLDMVISLLDISRLEAGQMPLRMNPCNMYDLARAAIQPLEALLGSRTIDVQRPEPPITVVCDIDLTRRVVANLVGNAIKYTGDDGLIQVHFEALPQAVKVSVTDNGPGIPREQHKRIFEKFSQARTEQRSLGVGLGLAFCKLAVEAHHGSIGVESDVGKGSTFWFILPEKPSETAGNGVKAT